MHKQNEQKTVHTVLCTHVEQADKYCNFILVSSEGMYQYFGHCSHKLLNATHLLIGDPGTN